MSWTADMEDYVLGAMDDDAAERFEDALFGEALSASASSGAAVGELLALIDGAREAVERETTLSLGTTEAAILAFEARGKRVMRWEVRDGGTVRGDVTRDLDLLVGRLCFDVVGVERADLELLDVDGTSRDARVDDVDLDRQNGCVWVPCDPRVAIAAERTLFRVHAHRADGRVTRHDFVAIIASD